MADSKIDYSYFCNVVNNFYALNEEYHNLLIESDNFALLEMAKLSKDESGLPRDLYIDDDQSYIRGGHGPRLKFQSPKHIKNKRNWPSITFSNKINNNSNINELECIGDKSDIYLDNKDINHIKYFIIANIDLLIKIANKEIDFNYFRHHFRIVDENGNIIKDPNKKEYVLYKNANYGFTIVKHQNGTFNYIKDKKLLSDKWFDLADIFTTDQRAFVRRGNQCGYLYTNGKLELI